jgi:hypothetical protein
VAHELNHSCQFAYDFADGDFIYEATAVWMEDVVFDSVNDYEFFIPDFQSRPERTLSFATYTDSYMYGGAVFVHYLADVYGGPVVARDMWEDLRLGNADWFDGVMAQLGSQGFGSISEVYADFAGIRFLTGQRDDGTFNEGPDLGSVALEASYNSLSELGGGETGSPMMGMGANYIRVLPAVGDAGKPVAFTLNGDPDEGPWWVTAVGVPASGAATVVVFPDEDDDGEVVAEVPDAGAYEQIGFVAINTANASQGVDSSQGGISKTTHSFSWSFGGGAGDDPVACGCRIPDRSRPLTATSVLSALVFGAGVIVLRRRAS